MRNRVMPWIRRFTYDGTLYVCNRIVARIPSHAIRLLFYRRVMKFEIGAGTFIFMDAWFDTKRSFAIGKSSIINQKCRLDNRGGLSIGDSVSISAEVCILTADHDVQAADFAGRDKPISIGDYVFIGTRALLLPGITIGQGAVVAAGSVVTRDVEPYSIVAGMPARVIGSRRKDLDYRIKYDRLFF